MRLEFDGASRNNPGHAGAGAVLVRDTTDEISWYDYAYLGKKTNNQAEYHALILGLEECVERRVWNLVICGDSQLILNQLQGIYAVNHKKLKPLHSEAMSLISQLPRQPRFQWIPREDNSTADYYANKAIDKELYEQYGYGYPYYSESSDDEEEDDDDGYYQYY